MQILRLKQYYEKQCVGELIKGPQMEKVLVEKLPGKIMEGPNGVCNKGLYVAVVVGKMQAGMRGFQSKLLCKPLDR